MFLGTNRNRGNNNMGGRKGIAVKVHVRNLLSIAASFGNFQ